MLNRHVVHLAILLFLAGQYLLVGTPPVFANTLLPYMTKDPPKIDGIIEKAGIHETVRLGNQLKAYLEARKDVLRPEALVYLKRLSGSMEEVI